MLNTTLPPWPNFSEEEAQVVASILRSNRVNYWTGEECRDFEREFAAWSGSDRAIALMNGTVALDLALQGLGIGAANGGAAEDEVVVTPRTFLASVSSVISAGARPVFADVERDSGNISAATIAPAISTRTRAIIPVHLAGWPADMDGIMALAAEHGIKVIEDCAQAHGARYRGRSVGSIGHVGAWSFCQDKIMTTGGEGGMVTCNDDTLWSRMWSYKDHGKSWTAVYERSHPPGFRWLHESFGTNWRMLEMQAGIGRIQLRHMAEWQEARRTNAFALTQTLMAYGCLRVPAPCCDACSGTDASCCAHAYYRLYAYVDPARLASGWNRDRIVAELTAAGCPCFQGSCSEVYLEKAFDGTDLRPEKRLPVARELGETSLMFLVHPTITADDIVRMQNAIDAVLSRACGA